VSIWKSEQMIDTTSTEIVDLLRDLFILRGVLGFARLDNGPGFVVGTESKVLAQILHTLCQAPLGRINTVKTLTHAAGMSY